MRANALRMSGAALILLALLAAWSYCQMTTHRSAAYRSAGELSDCIELAAQIKASDQEPQRVQAGALAHTDLTRRIERAAGAANIGSEALTRIDAAPPRRLAKLPYEERPTRVSLDAVSLPQLVEFLYGLSAQTHDLWVKDLRLRAPRGEEIGDRWQAETTISYLIYTPPDTPDTPDTPGTPDAPDTSEASGARSSSYTE